MLSVLLPGIMAAWQGLVGIELATLGDIAGRGLSTDVVAAVVIDARDLAGRQIVRIIRSGIGAGSDAEDGENAAGGHGQAPREGETSGRHQSLSRSPSGSSEGRLSNAPRANQ